MKNWKAILISVVIIVNTGHASPRVIDKIVTIVNNDVILESEVNNSIKFAKLDLEKEGKQIPDEFNLKNQVLEQLIMDKIILQIAHKMDLKVSDTQLDQVIEDIAGKSNITVDKMYSFLSENGIDCITYRNQLRKEILISAIKNQEISRHIIILPQEVNDVIKEIQDQNDVNTKINLSYIFIPFPNNPSFDQISKMEEKACSIVEKMIEDDKFIRSQKILKSNQIGWKYIQDLPNNFHEKLKKAKKGDIVGPISTNFGLYILKVNDLHNDNQNISVTEFHVRNILLKSLPINDEQTRIKLEKIASNIKNRKITFSEAAKIFSQDSNSSNQGGDLGWIEIKNYDLIFQNALINLNKGQMSAPFRSSSGWNLIELIDIRNIDKTEEIQKNRAYQILFDRKFLKEEMIWMNKQRANAYVKILSD